MRYGEDKVNEPAYFWPLLVTFDRDFKTVKLSRTHAYEMEDFCIGDIKEKEKWNQLRFGSGFRFDGPFKDVHWESESKAKFVKRLKQHMANGGFSLGSGVPVMPAYSEKKFRPRQHKNLGLTKWPKQDVDIAVRIVDHYSASIASIKEISFPWDIRLAVTRDDSIATIKRDICKKINMRGEEDEQPVTSSQIFGKRHRDRWEMELWVMPQTGPKRLYQWVEGDILEFLNRTDRVRTKDKKLYVEAHIVARRDE